MISVKKGSIEPKEGLFKIQKGNKTYNCFDAFLINNSVLVLLGYNPNQCAKFAITEAFESVEQMKQKYGNDISIKWGGLVDPGEPVFDVMTLEFCYLRADEESAYEITKFIVENDLEFSAKKLMSNSYHKRNFSNRLMLEFLLKKKYYHVLFKYSDVFKSVEMEYMIKEKGDREDKKRFAERLCAWYGFHDHVEKIPYEWLEDEGININC